MASSGPPLTAERENYKVTGYLTTGHYVIGFPVKALFIGDWVISQKTLRTNPASLSPATEFYWLRMTEGRRDTDSVDSNVDTAQSGQ